MSRFPVQNFKKGVKLKTNTWFTIGFLYYIVYTEASCYLHLRQNGNGWK